MQRQEENLPVVLIIKVDEMEVHITSVKALQSWARASLKNQHDGSLATRLKNTMMTIVTAGSFLPFIAHELDAIIFTENLNDKKALNAIRLFIVDVILRPTVHTKFKNDLLRACLDDDRLFGWLLGDLELNRNLLKNPSIDLDIRDRMTRKLIHAKDFVAMILDLPEIVGNILREYPDEYARIVLNSYLEALDAATQKPIVEGNIVEYAGDYQAKELIPLMKGVPLVYGREILARVVNHELSWSALCKSKGGIPGFFAEFGEGYEDIIFDKLFKDNGKPWLSYLTLQNISLTEDNPEIIKFHKHFRSLTPKQIKMVMHNLNNLGTSLAALAAVGNYNVDRLSYFLKHGADPKLTIKGKQALFFHMQTWFNDFSLDVKALTVAIQLLELGCYPGDPQIDFSKTLITCAKNVNGHKPELIPVFLDLGAHPKSAKATNELMETLINNETLTLPIYLSIRAHLPFKTKLPDNFKPNQANIQEVASHLASIESVAEGKTALQVLADSRQYVELSANTFFSICLMLSFSNASSYLNFLPKDILLTIIAKCTRDFNIEDAKALLVTCNNKKSELSLFARHGVALHALQTKDANDSKHPTFQFSASPTALIKQYDALKSRDGIEESELKQFCERAAPLLGHHVRLFIRNPGRCMAFAQRNIDQNLFVDMERFKLRLK